jgi:hypothetical protein
LVHCVDLHGNVYQPALLAATLVTQDGSNNQTGTVPQSGLVTLNAGDGIAASANDAGRLRWGFATNGVLARTRLVPPALPTGQNGPSLPRQFYRVAVVDTVWALLGNRTAGEVLGIPADDQTIAADVLPKVRDQVVIDYLVDGPDTLATASAVLARTPQGMVLAVSPVLDGGMTVPTQAGANAHWPAFPTPNTNAAFPSPPASPKDGLQAAFATGNDVVVAIAANKAPTAPRRSRKITSRLRSCCAIRSGSPGRSRGPTRPTSRWTSSSCRGRAPANYSAMPPSRWRRGRRLPRRILSPERTASPPCRRCLRR